MKAIRDLFNKKPEAKSKVETSIITHPDYLKWRNFIFAVRPDEVGVKIEDSEALYAVLMDVALADDKVVYKPLENSFIISIITFASIEASLRTSLGTGVIGIGAHEHVAQQIKKIFPHAITLFPLSKFVESPSLPSSGDVFFYFLTTKGLRLCQVTLRELQAAPHPLSELFAYFSQIKGVADKMVAEPK